ncbi:hypothetical protein Emed_003532 [Eimeria media]
MLFRGLAAAGGGLTRRGFFGLSLSAAPAINIHRSRLAAAAAAPAAAAAAAAPAAAAAAASGGVSAPQRCCCSSSFPLRFPAAGKKLDAFKWSHHVATPDSSSSSSSNCSSSSSKCSSSSSSSKNRHDGLRGERRRGRGLFEAYPSSTIGFAAAATQQQQQQQQQQLRCIIGAWERMWGGGHADTPACRSSKID